MNSRFLRMHKASRGRILTPVILRLSIDRVPISSVCTTETMLQLGIPSNQGKIHCATDCFARQIELRVRLSMTCEHIIAQVLMVYVFEHS